jgi:hypothetical protein
MADLPDEVYLKAARWYDHAINAALRNPPGVVLGPENQQRLVEMPHFRAAVESAYGDGHRASLEPQPDNPLYQDLRQALNRNSAENGSNTPDYVLADFLMQSLRTFDYAVRYRASATETSPLDPNPGSTLFKQQSNPDDLAPEIPGIQTVLKQHAKAVQELLSKAKCAVCGDPAVELVQAKPARFSANRDLDDALTFKILEEVLPLCAAHPDVRTPVAPSDPYLWESGT